MAVPTFASISPIAGHTGGKCLVEINGTNFRLPTQPAAGANGLVPEAKPSVQVLFGATPATEVMVVSTTKLYCLTPIANAGAVSVTIQNLDANGVAIGGEAVTQASAYTFQLPDLTAESDLARIFRAFIQELKRQITPNVSWPAATDYDDTTGDALSVSKLADLPGLIIAEAEFKEDKWYQEPEQEQLLADGVTYVRKRRAVIGHLEMLLVGVSNSSVEMLNLMAATKMFFAKNLTLAVAKDPSDAGAGTADFELWWREEPDVQLTIQANDSNVRHFSGRVQIRQVALEDMPGLPVGGPGETSTRAHEGTVGIGKTADIITHTPTQRKA